MPHSWNAADWQSPSYRRGPGWYRRTLTLPDAWGGKRVFLRFDAAGTSADVYVNGRAVGHHVGAFAAFAVEITGEVRPGTSAVLAVRVSNAPRDDMPPLGGDFNLFGGLLPPRDALRARADSHQPARSRFARRRRSASWPFPPRARGTLGGHDGVERPWRRPPRCRSSPACWTPRAARSCRRARR